VTHAAATVAKCATRFAAALLGLAAALPGCAASERAPAWAADFGYADADVHAIEIGDFGYPNVPVDVAGTRLMLPFDTGNMVGLSVSTALFDELGLVAERTITRLDSAGRKVATSRVASGVEVSLLGRGMGSMEVSELDHPTLPGLAGPTLIDGGHVTFDYASRRMALDSGETPIAVPGFRSLPLVRSREHPWLILVRGRIEGRSVLMELDTGKSRCVVNPGLARELDLARGPRGVALRELRLGDLVFDIPSAKEVDQTAVDPGLPEPLLAGVGSDVLRRFVWTVDYERGLLWIPDGP
jgi:hypothetical protein